MGGAGGGKVRAEGSMPHHERLIWGKLLHLAIGSSQNSSSIGTHPFRTLPGPSLLVCGEADSVTEGAGRGEPGGCPLSSSIPALISGPVTHQLQVEEALSGNVS